MDAEEPKAREACRKAGVVERERCPTCGNDDGNINTAIVAPTRGTTTITCEPRAHCAY